MSWRLTPRFDGDPYGNWLRSAGHLEVEQGWHPRILYTRWGIFQQAAERAPQGIGPSLETLFSGNSAYRVNLHDLEHWVHCDASANAPHFGQGYNELIIFERHGNPNFDLPDQLAQILGVSAPDAITATQAGAPMKTAVPGSLSGQLVASVTAGQGISATPPQTLGAGATGHSDGTPLVVTALIDHAIPFAHQRFRQGRQDTRVDGIWMQGLSNDGGSLGPAIGRALSKPDIDALLGNIGGTLQSEDALYRSLSAPASDGPITAGDDPLAQSYCHGGMMLDLAAGRDMADPNAGAHRILAVELPAQIVALTNGFMHEAYVKSALNWVWYTARALYGNHPHEVILNYSFGDYSGRRDGQGQLEADFQLRLDRRELAAITVSAGNGFQSDCHAEISASEMAQGQDVVLCLQPDDKTPSFVQFWLEGHYERLPFQLSITPPSTSGIAPCVTSLEEDLELLSPSDPTQVVARAYLQQDDPPYALPTSLTAKPRTRVTLAFAPTRVQTGRNSAPAGRWTLSFAQAAKQALPGTEKVMLWVERGDSLPGFLPSGRQAYLDHPNHRRISANGRFNEVLDPADSPIKRANTLSSNAFASDVISVAAFRSGPDGRPAAYSAAGGIAAPTIAVAVELSDSRRSVLGAGTLSGAIRLGNGTSAASAAMSRHLAESLLSAAVPIGAPDIVQRLRSHVIAQAQPVASAERAGAGVMPMLPGRAVLRHTG